MLFQINIASKILQSKTVNFSQAVAVLKSIENYLTGFCENGFVICLVKAKELAEDLQVEAEYLKHPGLEGRRSSLITRVINFNRLYYLQPRYFNHHSHYFQLLVPFKNNVCRCCDGDGEDVGGRGG